MQFGQQDMQMHFPPEFEPTIPQWCDMVPPLMLHLTWSWSSLPKPESFASEESFQEKAECGDRSLA